MARLNSNHLTRRRTLPLPTVVSFLLSGVHAAVQSELDQFFANLCNRADSFRKVTAPAFYQARDKISALVFGEVNQHLMGGWRNTCRSRAGEACGWSRRMAARCA